MTAVIWYLLGVLVLAGVGWYLIKAKHKREDFERRWRELNPKHYDPPTGYLPCTRTAPHDGPCAHPEESAFEKSARQFAEGVEDAFKNLGRKR